MTIQFSHTQKLEAWAQGKHAVIWLDGNTRISENHMHSLKRQLVSMLVNKGAVLFASDWQVPELPRALCSHCDEYISLPYSKYCPFCYEWAKQHGGELPADSVLDARNTKANKYGPKDGNK